MLGLTILSFIEEKSVNENCTGFVLLLLVVFIIHVLLFGVLILLVVGLIVLLLWVVVLLVLGKMLWSLKLVEL